jgi:predicted molibdopterin-dependent oxidoreductase YjgC
MTPTLSPGQSEIVLRIVTFTGVTYEKLDRLGSIQWPCNDPHDAEVRGIGDGDWIGLTSRAGETVLRARVTEKIAPGVVYTTFHFQKDAWQKRAHEERSMPKQQRRKKRDTEPA